MLKNTIYLIITLILLASCNPVTKDDQKIPIDSTRITTASFRVLGMDSITINRVQDTLQKVYGITLNFACYSDTVVFVEYDSGIVAVKDIEDAIKRSGFQPIYEGKN